MGMNINEEDIQEKLSKLESDQQKLREEKVENDKYDMDLYQLTKRVDLLEKNKGGSTKSLHKISPVVADTSARETDSGLDVKLIDLINARLEKLDKKLSDLTLQTNNQTEANRIEISELQKKTLSVVSQEQF